MAIAGAALMAAACSAPPSSRVSLALEAIDVDILAVPLDPTDSERMAIGEFTYAGGLQLSSRATDGLHGLSDLRISGADHLLAVGDDGVLFEARLVLDDQGRLTGVVDGRLGSLTGRDGAPLRDKIDADAEGLALLPDGDTLISFERRHRIWLYPRDGSPPREAPAPDAAFDTNGGMEALAADPDAGADAYVVGAQQTGETWTCSLSAAACVAGPTIDKPDEFDLVAMRRLPGHRTAYLLRRYDPDEGSHVVLEILEADGTLVTRMDMTPPVTIDNFEGVAAVPRANGSIRFYLLSDDNSEAAQRTLLLAFDWRSR